MSTTIFDDSKLYRSVLEDLPVGVYIVDLKRRVRFWNRGAEHLTGHLPHEVIRLVRGMIANEPLRRPQTPRELIDRLVALEIATFLRRLRKRYPSLPMDMPIRQESLSGSMRKNP